MLRITIKGREFFDEETFEFVEEESTILELEHSLASLSKWESIWRKPFLSEDKKTEEEALSYVKCMALDEDVDETLFERITDEHVSEIVKYINQSMTATWFTDDKKPKAKASSEAFTAEIIYYWMLSSKIPMECQYWHLDRLLTLIKVFNEKNAPPKKMSRREVADRHRQLNAQRRAQFNTKG